MKIACVIKPRADGTVKFVFAGKEYVFRRELSGEMACNVDEKDVVRAMLATDRFYPMQAEDEPLAQKIVQDASLSAAASVAQEPQRRTRRSKKVE